MNSFEWCDHRHPAYHANDERRSPMSESPIKTAIITGASGGSIKEKPCRPAHPCRRSLERLRFRRFAWLKTAGIPVILRKYRSPIHSTHDGEIGRSL